MSSQVTPHLNLAGEFESEWGFSTQWAKLFSMPMRDQRVDMEFRRIGKTDVFLPVLGFGTWEIGGRDSPDYSQDGEAISGR